MNLSEPFVRRPIGTILLTIGVALAGIGAYFNLPVSPLPQVDFPTISVQAQLAGASPETMATSVATPLERHLGIISDVSEMTSSSRVGLANITLQFGLDRNIDGAARDVEAAINAARIDLPQTLRTNPTYRKVNPADSPIMVLALTSATKTPGQIYDAASNIVQQQLSQVRGVGDVEVGGASLPAVRVELNPLQLAHYGVALEDVRAALASANANRPKGVVDDGPLRYQVYTNDDATKAADYAPLLIAYRNGSAVRLSDIAQVVDGVEDIHNLGVFVKKVNGKAVSSPAVVVTISRQPGANIISTVDAVKARLPAVEGALPQDIKVDVGVDRTTTIRASLEDVERTVIIAVVLVVGVVAVFLMNGNAVLIPSVAVAVSLLGTLGVMLLLGFSLDNLSLMALTISTGFVVDDAIVVLENVTRHVEAGMGRFEAALKGAEEVGFTVLSISISLIAVFLPILLMGGLYGRIFREFAITLSAAVLISLVISLTTTPMMAAYLVGKPKAYEHKSWFGRLSERSVDGMRRVYERALDLALDSGPVIVVVLIATIALNFYLFSVIPKGFFPEEDTGLMIGGLQADQSSSFQITEKRLRQFVEILGKDKDVQSVVAFLGGGRGAASAFMITSLAPKGVRGDSTEDVMARLRPQLARVTGASLFLAPVQDLRIGGRQSNATYQYTLEAQNLADLREWATKLNTAMQAQWELEDVSTDQQDHGLQSYVTIDEDKAAGLGLNNTSIDNVLYDAFGQRDVSTIYEDVNQYHVVMEVAPQYAQDPTTLRLVYVSSGRGAPTPVGSAAAQGQSPIGISIPASNVTPLTTALATASGGLYTAPVSNTTPLTKAYAAGRSDRRRRDHRAERAPGAGRLHRRGGLQHLRVRGPAVGFRHLGRLVDAHLGQPPGHPAGDHHLVQPRRGPVAERRHRGDPARLGAGRTAVDGPRRLRRQRPRLPAAARHADPADRRRDRGDLPGAGHPLRELHPPADGALHLALRRRGRLHRPLDLPHRVLADRLHRDHPPDRDREEERHHDDRLRPRRRTPRGSVAARGDPQRRADPLPSDHDDHLRRHPGRRAAGHRLGRGRRAAPATRRHHHRRPAGQPGDHPFDHPRHLPLSGPLPASGAGDPPGPRPGGAAASRRIRVAHVKAPPSPRPAPHRRQRALRLRGRAQLSPPARADAADLQGDRRLDARQPVGRGRPRRLVDDVWRSDPERAGGEGRQVQLHPRRRPGGL